MCYPRCTGAHTRPGSTHSFHSKTSWSNSSLRVHDYRHRRRTPMSRMRSLNAQLQRAGLGDAVCCGQQRRTTDPRPRKSPSLLQPLGTHSAAFAAPARPACSAASCSSSTSSVSSNWRCRTCSTGRQRRFVCRAADDAKAAPVKQQLPIFVLGLVAFPHAVVPLMIFEPRWVSTACMLPSRCTLYSDESMRCTNSHATA